MDRNQWRSPSFRERSPHPRHLRFQNAGGFGGTPRQFSPQQWRPRHQSPKYHQNSFEGNMFSPQQRSPFDDFMTSTPYHGRGRQPYHHRGGGRFNKRQSFGSPHFANDRNSDDINNWISPEMWSDPWRHLTNQHDDTVDSSRSHLLCTPSNAGQTQESTKFADTDFDVSKSIETEVIPADENDGASKNESDDLPDPKDQKSCQDTSKSDVT